MKIKVIDLLNMISKGEDIPKKIRWQEEILTKSKYLDSFTYTDEDGDYFFSDKYSWEENINSEIEIEEPIDGLEFIEQKNDRPNKK